MFTNISVVEVVAIVFVVVGVKHGTCAGHTD